MEAAHARALAVRLEASEAARAEAEAELAALRAEVAVLRRVERFDRRGTEPFELFEPFEFFQNRNFA